MTGAFFLDEMEIRQRISDAGRAAVGMSSVGAPEAQKAYEEWLFPHPDDDKFQAAMADAMYSCGLNARSCLRAAGVDAPELSAPYSKNIGSIFAWLTNVARRMNAYVDLSSPTKLADAPALDAGDVVVVSGPDHVIVLIENLGGGRFRTSEGGRPVLGANGEKGMCIHSRVVVAEVRSDGRLWIGGVDDRTGLPTKGRRAEWAISARWLRTREGLAHQPFPAARVLGSPRRWAALCPTENTHGYEDIGRSSQRDDRQLLHGCQRRLHRHLLGHAAHGRGHRALRQHSVGIARAERDGGGRCVGRLGDVQRHHVGHQRRRDWHRDVLPDVCQQPHHGAARRHCRNVRRAAEPQHCLDRRGRNRRDLELHRNAGRLMKRVSAYRIHCQGLGPVAGLYTSPPPQDHIDAWAAKDVAVFGTESRHGKRWVVKVEMESLYVDGPCESHFADASHPDELRPPPAPSAAGDAELGELGALGFGTVTNPG